MCRQVGIDEQEPVVGELQTDPTAKQVSVTFTEYVARELWDLHGTFVS